MKKEIYICDRCGKEMQHTVSESKYMNALSKLKQTAKIKTEVLERRGYVSDYCLSLPQINEMEVIEYYHNRIKEYILCSDCRKAFMEFIKNEH